MITPSKTIPFKDSIVFKMTIILDDDFDEIPLIDLYNKKKTNSKELMSLFIQLMFYMF